MGGGRTKDGTPIYRRRNGVYQRIDGKPVRHRLSSDNIVITDHAMVSPTVRSAMTPLPRNGKEVSGFLQTTRALDDLNDNRSGSYISKAKRKDGQLYQKLISGQFNTQNGGFLFQSERDKNNAFLKYNDMPGFDDVLNQVIPQLTPQNLKQVKRTEITTSVDGKLKMWVYETFVTNNLGERIRTYVKVLPMHSDDGKPYTIMVSLHRTGPIQETATRAQKGL